MKKELEDLKNHFVNLLFEYEDAVEQLDDDQQKRHVENLKQIQKVINSATDDFENVRNLGERLIKSNNITPKEDTLLDVFAYLLLAEGYICNILNFISHLLVMTGHDLFSLTKRKYVNPDFKEIRKVEMSTKIKFLNYHGFRALTKEYDSTFRNDVAHHNYFIDEKGTLWVRGKSINFLSKINALDNIMEFIGVAMNEKSKKNGYDR